VEAQLRVEGELLVEDGAQAGPLLHQGEGGAHGLGRPARQVRAVHADEAQEDALVHLGHVPVLSLFSIVFSSRRARTRRDSSALIPMPSACAASWLDLFS